jgi:uncharacterized repeat protein (TIGR01451 family)
MSILNYKQSQNLHRFFAGLIIIAMLASTMPISVFADVETPTSSPSGEVTTATSTNDGTTGTTSTSTDDGTDGANDNAASSTATTTTDGGNASSTDDGTDGTNSTSTDDGTDGANGEAGTEANNGDTATTTPPADEGQTGDTGSDGSAGAGGPDGSVTPDDGEPITIVSDGLIGDPDATDEEEDVTGSKRDFRRTALIETGIATARAELFTDANSNDVRSELTPEAIGDLDIYTFMATGTNEAIVSNDGAILSSTGDNTAGTGNTKEATINTGTAISAFNIANIINTNVINSQGLIYLGNKILSSGESLDLTNSFFPQAAASPTNTGECSLLSCAAEDVVYTISQTNTATVTNSAIVEASTGFNDAAGELSARVTTGDAFASANVMNVVNTNIIDSNYQLITFNAIGDLEGDLILPTEDLFKTYFAQPNGLNQLESGENATVSITNGNDAVVNNHLDTYGQTGNNKSTTSFDSSTKTGLAETESNVLNKVNKNTYGGDSFYLLVRVHGYWDGEVIGLPAGLTWDWIPGGIVIYNADAEIAPSEMLGFDIDSYSAQINNQNNSLYLENDLTIKAITGENKIQGLIGNIETGDAFASANVMNIANTNVVGTNWTYAVINILGDLDGNISFASTDLALAGSVSSDTDPAGPSDTLTYDYTITNNSSKTATNVVLEQILENAYTSTDETWQSTSLGSIAPGASKQATFSAIVNPTIPVGTSTLVSAYAKVTSDIGDKDFSDNLLKLSRTAFHPDSSNQDGAGTTTDPGDTSTSTNTGDTGTTTDPGDTGTTTNTSNEEANVPPTYTPPSTSGGGGGGGGGSSSRNKKVDREVTEIDPDKQPLISIKKVADVKKGETIDAGDSVDYTITVTNKGGNAYDAEVFDVLTNPIGSEMSSQSWDLGTILPGEEIKLTYTTDYNIDTPSGIYTNTASVKAYLDEDTKASDGKPLNIEDAVYKLNINGVALAIGNVATIAFFPTADGQVAALMAWETSTSSLSRIYYGPYQTLSPYDANKPNLGYRNESLMFPDEKTTHYMILMGLKPGTSYGYRVHSQNDTDVTISREHTFVVPYFVNKLTLAVPATPTPTPQVAGASNSTPTYPTPTPTPVYVPPTPTSKPVTTPPPPAPTPEPAVVETPTPEPEPEPTPTAEPEKSESGFFNKVVNFFSW